MKRLVALVFAAALVVGAVFVRRALEDDEGGGNGPDPRGTPSVVCVPEVAEACDALEDDGVVRVARTEAGGVTADRLAAGEELGADGWLVASFWPEVANLLRDRAQSGRALASSDPVAHTDVVLGLADGERADAECGGTTTWACVGAMAGAPPFRTGVDDPDQTSGLAVVATALASQVGEVPPRPEDLDDADGDWFRRFAASLDQGRAGLTSLETLATIRGQLDVAGGLASDAPRSVEARTPDPRATVAVAVAVETADGLDRFELDRIADALADAGWTASDAAPSGLPGAGVMEALRRAWKDAVR